jgi:ParB family transcriptional regulator, chromosome partitioning protein
MARPNDSDEARANRLASMTRAASSGPASDPEARAFEGRSRLKEAASIRRDRIAPDPHQPRIEFDTEGLEQLASSLRDRGQLQPIRVRYDAQADTYVIVLGERRWRAAGLAGLETMACLVVDDGASPEDLLEDQLVENCLRQDLRPVELARSYQALMTARGLSQRALAERLHVSPASVAKAVALLTLPEAIQQDVDSGAIGPDVAYQISKVEDLEEQIELAGRAVAGTVRRDELQDRTRGTSIRQGRGGRRPWVHDASGRVRITVAPLAEDVSQEELLEAMKAAMAALRKAGASRRSGAA